MSYRGRPLVLDYCLAGAKAPMMVRACIDASRSGPPRTVRHCCSVPAAWDYLSWKRGQKYCCWCWCCCLRRPFPSKGQRPPISSNGPYPPGRLYTMRVVKARSQQGRRGLRELRIVPSRAGAKILLQYKRKHKQSSIHDKEQGQNFRAPPARTTFYATNTRCCGDGA